MPAVASPLVVAASSSTVDYLDGFTHRAVVMSSTDGSIWEKNDDSWWTTGSEVPLDSSDLAARGPFTCIRFAIGF